MDKLFNDFLREKVYLKNILLKTQKSYKEAFDRFQRAKGDLSKAGLNSFVVWMREQGLSPVTCNIYIRSINSFLYLAK